MFFDESFMAEEYSEREKDIDNFCEYGLSIAADAEYNFNAIMESLAIYELKGIRSNFLEAEESKEEEKDNGEKSLSFDSMKAKQGFIAKTKQFFKVIWSKIKAMWHKLKNFVIKYYTKAKNYISKKFSNIKDAIKVLFNKKTVRIPDVAKMNQIEVGNSPMANAQKEEIRTQITNIPTMSKEDIETVTKAIDKASDETNEVMKKINDAYIDKPTVEQAQALIAAMDEYKKKVNDGDADIKTFEDLCKKASEAVDAKKDDELLAARKTLLHKVQSQLARGISVECEVARRCMAAAVKLLSAAANTNKWEKAKPSEEPKQENADYIFGDIDLI